jgi:hypothetical protein
VEYLSHSLRLAVRGACFGVLRPLGEHVEEHDLLADDHAEQGPGDAFLCFDPKLEEFTAHRPRVWGRPRWGPELQEQISQPQATVTRPTGRLRICRSTSLP